MAVTRGTLQIARRLRRDIGHEVDAAVRTLTTDWVREWDSLAPAWHAAATQLVASAVALGRRSAPMDLMRDRLVDQAMRGSIAALDKLAERTETVASDGADRIIQLDVEREARIIASQAPDTEQPALARMLGVRTDTRATEALREAWQVREDARTDIRLTVQSRIRTDAVNVITARAGRQIHADTLPLSPQAVDAMRRELISGIDVGANPSTAAARMVAAVEGRFNGGLTRALNISRTELLEAYRATSQQIHAANADIVPAWSWLASFDTRVCPSCLSLHGTVYPVSQPGPEDHQQGRCARLPQLAPWSQLGISAPEPPSAMPSAEEWFNGLPHAVQLQIMGPGRLQLLDDGLIGWGDLSTLRQSPGWRPSRVPTPVRDLHVRASRGLPPTPRPARAQPARVTAPRAAPVPQSRLGTTALPIPEPPRPRFIEPDRAQAMQDRMLADNPWTDAQRNALRHYSGHAYGPMNTWLRSPQLRAMGTTGDPEYPVDLITNDLIPNATRAMRPLPERVTVTRRTGAAQFGLELDDLDAGLPSLRGQVVQDPGFTSTTVDPFDVGVVAQVGDIRLQIDVPRGYPAAYVDGISEFRGEHELILPPGAKLRILDVQPSGFGGWHVLARVVV